ncbi:hypothetical protein [Sphingomonas sp.]|uniref:hypothetical protein n=1 Tax=Sphingomonas sp. TaxID=28214 RepID=UPI003D6DA713
MSVIHPVKLILTMLVVLFAASCGGKKNSASESALLQRSSPFGETKGWDMSPPLSLKEVQGMRDRAYQFCSDRKSKDNKCLKEQDASLNFYVKSFSIRRILLENTSDSAPFATAIRRNPAALDQVHRYCRSVYVDHGAGDARELGPCMAAGLGADFFGVLPVD